MIVKLLHDRLEAKIVFCYLQKISYVLIQSGASLQALNVFESNVFG